MFLRKFQFVSQVVGTVTILLLALYGLMGLPQRSAAAWAAEIAPPSTGSGTVEMSIAQNAPSAQWGEATVPLVMDYKGYVRGAEGQPLSGYYTITFRMYEEVIASEALWSETHENVTVRDGYFSVLLGNNTPISDTLVSNQPDRFIGVTVDPYDELVPRQRLASVPYAIHSFHATNADHATEADHAKEADHAIEADHAENATQAENALQAVQAARAENVAAKSGVVSYGEKIPLPTYPDGTEATEDQCHWLVTPKSWAYNDSYCNDNHGIQQERIDIGIDGTVTGRRGMIVGNSCGAISQTNISEFNYLVVCTK